MHQLPQARPIIESNITYLNGGTLKPKLFLPAPTIVLTFVMFFSLVFMTGLFFAIKPSYDGFRLNRSGLRVNGEVVSVESYNVKNGQRYRATYTFRDPVGVRTATDEGLRDSDVRGLSKGSPVPVVYLQANASVSSLGLPGKLWGEKGRNDYIVVPLLALPLIGYGVWQFVTASREWALENKLLASGKVIEAETVSADWSEGNKGKITTVVTYRVPLQNGSILGTASYATMGRGKVRCPRAGEKIPILFVDEESHRPL